MEGPSAMSAMRAAVLELFEDVDKMKQEKEKA